MSTRRIKIGRSSRDTNLALLFVPHGFTDRAAFHALCQRALKQAVSERALDPLKMLKRHVRAWSSWPALQEVLSSNSDGVFMDDPPALFSHLASLAMPKKFPFDFWVDPTTRFGRGVIVISNEFSKPAVTPHLPSDIILHGADTSPESQSGTYGLGPFVVMTSWPFAQNSAPIYSSAAQRERAMAGQVAKAIGYLLGLGPELDVSASTTAYHGLDPLFPNLTILPAVPAGQTVDLSSWKWRAYRKRSVGVQGAVRDHPRAGASSADVDPLVALTKTETLVLRHPGGTASIRYVEPPLRKLRGIGTHLIEGGLGSPSGIYRPAVECTMRHSGWDKTMANGDVVRKLVGYCQVCRMHISRVAYGLGDYYLSTTRIVKVAGIPSGANVAGALRDFVENEMPDLTHGHSCVEATTNRVYAFFKSVMPHFLEHQEKLKDWKAWQNNGFGIPSRRLQGNWTVAIWLSRLNALRVAFDDLEPFAGLGAAGALAWAGFGAIVNRYDLNRSTELKISVFDSLIVADLAKLTPGSMLQIWTEDGTDDTYDWVMRYIASDSGRIPVGERIARITPAAGETVGDSMPGAGHSLIYLGPKDPNKPVASRTAHDYLVADQNVIATMSQADSLGEWADEGFNFWIAMEWYPIEGLP